MQGPLIGIYSSVYTALSTKPYQTAQDLPLDAKASNPVPTVRSCDTGTLLDNSTYRREEDVDK